MAEKKAITLRKAEMADLAYLKHWDEQAHVIDADPNDDWAWEEELAKDPPWREQLMALHGQRPLGFIQIIDPAEEETHYWGDVEPDLRALDIWIGEAADLNRGFGTTMMHLALARCFKPPRVKAVLIDPLARNQKARRFYQRFGFAFQELRQFGEDLCAVYRLERAVYFERHGKKVP